MKFKKKVLIVGYGSVSETALPILLDHIKIPYKNITIIDIEDKSKDLKKFIKKGLSFHREQIEKKNLKKVLAKYLERGGLLIDLAWNIDCCELLQWCHDNEVFYVNTSVEVWDPKEEIFKATPYEKTLYYRQMKIRELSKGWKNSVTAVLDHGANPGLISHFAKQGAIDIANRLISDKKVGSAEAKGLRTLIADKKFGELAMRLGIKVIHCSERDTQITDKPKEVDEFVGTWSIEGLREEGTAPAELGWGTHEKVLPPLAHVPTVGPKNQICLAQMGMNTYVRSWVPDFEIVGMLIRHGEAFGISDRWTVWKNGKAIYRPTVHYAYYPSDETIKSLHELRARNYELQPKLRIMRDEIIKGDDILGCLLMGHEYKSWWTGSILSIKKARKLAKHENATTVQVAIGIVAAVMWMLENPKKGVCLPDDLPHDYVLKIAKPYLGRFVSVPADWTPMKNRKVYFKENPAAVEDKENLWHFKNFMFVS